MDLSRLRRRLLDGELSRAVEMMLWHYAKGKPTDVLEVSGADRGPLTISWLPSPPASKTSLPEGRAIPPEHP